VEDELRSPPTKICTVQPSVRSVVAALLPARSRGDAGRGQPRQQAQSGLDPMLTPPASYRRSRMGSGRRAGLRQATTLYAAPSALATHLISSGSRIRRIGRERNERASPSNTAHMTQASGDRPQHQPASVPENYREVERAPSGRQSRPHGRPARSTRTDRSAPISSPNPASRILAVYEQDVLAPSQSPARNQAFHRPRKIAQDTEGPCGNRPSVDPDNANFQSGGRSRGLPEAASRWI
jgi:hypothetical protein